MTKKVNYPSDEKIKKMLLSSREDAILGTLFIGLKYSYRQLVKVKSGKRIDDTWKVRYDYDPTICISYKDKLLAIIGSHIYLFTPEDPSWRDPGDEEYSINEI